MSYKHHKIIGIRKMKWDMLWHIMYTIRGEFAYDRVDKKEALKALEVLERKSK